MIGGLSEQDLQIIREVLASYPMVIKALLFGSRAKGNYKPGSDVDIALFGDGVENHTATIAGILNDESPLPYYFDVLDYGSLANSELRGHIDRVGILIYSRDAHL